MPISRFRAALAVLAVSLPFAACSSSNNDPAPQVFDASQYVGTWTGTWTNQTFSSTGAASVVVTNSGSNFTVAVDLGGNVFGGSDPASENFNATVSQTAASLTATTSAVYGTVSSTLNALQQITAQGTAVPGGNVTAWTLTGTWNGTTLNVTVTITLAAGGTATATAALTKQ